MRLSRAFTIALLGSVLNCFAAVGGRADEMASRHSVLIFYANETSKAAVRSENYAKVFAVLHRIGGVQAGEVSASIMRDAERFPALVKRDIRHVMAAAQRWKFDAAVFTNELALEGRYLFYRAAADKIEQSALPQISPPKNAILATSPLARPDVFRAALIAVVSQYPKNSLDAVLITDTHGSGEMALIPRVNADLSRPNAEREMQQILQSDDNGVPPDWAELQGTNKLLFWQTISDIGSLYRVRFPLVFREACDSGLRTWREYRMLPESVNLIAHSAMGKLDSANISYAAIFSDFKPGADWPSVLSQGLRDDGVHVNSRWTIWPWVALISLGSIPSIVFFVPLGAWLIWYLGGIGARWLRDDRKTR